MTENTKDTADAIKIDQNAKEMTGAPAASSAKYTLDYALEQLEKVQAHSQAFAQDILEKTQEISPEDIGTQQKGQALQALIKEHEETNRKLIDFYCGMINEIKPHKDSQSIRNDFLEFVENCMAESDPVTGLPDFTEIWNLINS